MESVTSFFWNEDQKSATANKSGKRATTDPHKSNNAHNVTPNTAANATAGMSGAGLQKLMTDTLIEKIMKMALPPSSEMAVDNIENRMLAAKGRPGLSVQIMSRNFVQMNSRLSLPFTFIDELIKIFNWNNPAYTISVVFLFTYIVLKPLPTITSIPIFYLLFGVMVPQYLYIHKPNYSPFLDCNYTPAQGPPLRKAEVPKPVPELSQEFILNLTDLQNHLMLYVRTYDILNSILVRFAFFTNEKISTVAFVFLLGFAFFNALFMDFFMKYIPIKAILLIFGWSFAIVMHPSNREKFFSTIYSEETRLRLLTFSNKYEKLIDYHLRFTEAREHRMVAVFEIQKYEESEKGWVPIGYSSDDYTLFSELRINQQDIEGHCAVSLEEVKPPVCWEWLDNVNWALDLDPNEWLEQGFVEYIDVDLGTKWVYDLNVDGSRGCYRRRMWTNLCVRKINYEAEHDDDDDTPAVEEIVNPLRQEKYVHGVHRVTRGSMSGASQPDEIGKDGSQTVKRNSSNISLSSTLSSSSSTHSNKGESSKAISSLADVLNTTV